MPFLVVHGADDKVVPVLSAKKLFEAVGAEDKHLKIFTAGEGGFRHDVFYLDISHLRIELLSLIRLARIIPRRHRQPPRRVRL